MQSYLRTFFFFFFFLFCLVCSIQHSRVAMRMMISFTLCCAVLCCAVLCCALDCRWDPHQAATPSHQDQVGAKCYLPCICCLLG
jgi:hypothetical protein